jgi:exodeoxyribonuclease V beta subunit
MTVDSIDLSRHAVIEASAGTGKTYTIENLVLRLLIETGTLLDNILLVTFTEKATGELRARLRLTLESTIRDRPEHREVLLPALDHFDQAPIFTIHGFCQRLLQEHALEQGQDFRAALVDDAELLTPALREVQRKVWRAQFADRLRDVLERAAFGRDSATDWDGRVREVAEKYQPRCDHQLRPLAVPDWWQRMDELGANVAGQLEVFTVDAVRRHLVEHKRQRGLQSFDDMVGTVEESLDPERNPDAPHLLQRLRERYRFGIVDEFQDTDPLQWRIFRRIFLEGGTSRLFVVGDPKQAIFGFRGADLPTYLKAAAEMREHHGAVQHPLRENGRSAPELLDALSCLFLDGDWFPKETGIRYLEVHAPDEEKRRTRIVTDLTNRAALTVVDLRAWDRLRDARKHFARFVAQEIRRLLQGSGGQPALVLAHKGPERPLEPSDICILIFKRTEAEPITDALEDAGIPYSFHRQTGFWQSEPVRQLETVLRCLSRPEERASFRKALLTWFFRIRTEELVRCPDLPAGHPARRLYQHWIECTERRRWSALFQSMLEETGLLLRATENVTAAEQLAGLRHVMAILERVGHGEGRDLLGLLDWIRDQRRQRDGGEAELAPAEAHRPRVRIMTIHASKGLEFPVVFLAGGFTGRGRFTGVTTYRDEQGRKVFNFCPDGDALARMADEQLSEHRRLLYVALTRPMFKLYVPMVPAGKSTRTWAGPAGTVLLPALVQACPDKLGPLTAEVIVPPRLLDLDDAAESADDPPLDVRPPIAHTGALFPALDTNLEWRRIVVRSFSSLNRNHVAQIGAGPSYGQHLRSAPDEIAGAADEEDPLRGPVFGDVVHRVLEAIDYTEVGHSSTPLELLLEGTPARALIQKEIHANIGKLHGTPRGKDRDELEQSAQSQVAQLVWGALHTPLSEVGGPLWRIPAGDRIHELEFQFREQAEDARREEGFVLGFMDLVFRQGDRYFLVDFKTNLLAGYSPEQLARCMSDADYHRQYRLYLHALSRWLRRVHGARFDFLRHCGGVYYLFVRGLNGHDETAGVYFHQPTAADLDLALALGRP